MRGRLATALQALPHRARRDITMLALQHTHGYRFTCGDAKASTAVQRRLVRATIVSSVARAEGDLRRVEALRMCRHFYACAVYSQLFGLAVVSAL